MLATIVATLTFDEILAIIGLVVNSMQALVLPITIYLLVVQTRAMRVQTTALVEQSKEMTAQTRVFVDTIYSATYQSLYDAEAHIGELMMTYPEASRYLMTPKPPSSSSEDLKDNTDPHKAVDPEMRERVRWLGTAMLDFFEHIWTQSQKGGLPKDVWEAWEEYIGKMLSETRLRAIWQTERGYYSTDFRRFVDLKVGLAPDMPAMPPLPRPISTGTLNLTDKRSTETAPPPQVARVLRAVTEEKDAT